MDTSVVTTLISTSGAVIVGLGGMWISANQTGKRIDDLHIRLGDVMKCLDRIEDELRTFKDVVNGKLSALDLELAKLMDRGH